MRPMSGRFAAACSARTKLPAARLSRNLTNAGLPSSKLSNSLLVSASVRARGEHLGRTTAAVIADEIDLGDVECVEERAEHRGLVAERERLAGANRDQAQAEHVERDDPADIRQAAQLVAPLEIG